MRRLAVGLDGQVDDATGRHRGPHGEAVQLAVQLGDHQADRLGGAGRGGDQVDRRRARPAQVAVGHVLQALIGGVGVDRGHQAVLDPDRVVEHLGHRGQAVGRARGVRDHVVVVAVVDLVEVDAERDGDVRLGGRRRDQHLLGAGGEVLGGVLAVGEQSGGLDHHLGAQLAPGQLRRIRSVKKRISLPSTRMPGVGRLHVSRKRPVVGVVLEQVRDHLRIADVVGGDPLDVGALLVGGPEDVAADAPEAVDSHAYRHPRTSFDSRQKKRRQAHAGTPKATGSPM